MSLSKLLVAGLALTSVADAAKSLKDIKHVIMFMQENRSFQHVHNSQYPTMQAIV
jgi:phospholipase C